MIWVLLWTQKKQVSLSQLCVACLKRRVHKKDIFYIIFKQNFLQNNISKCIIHQKSSKNKWIPKVSNNERKTSIRGVHSTHRDESNRSDSIQPGVLSCFCRGLIDWAGSFFVLWSFGLGRVQVNKIVNPSNLAQAVVLMI